MKKQVFSIILTVFFLMTITVIAQKSDYPTKKINGVEYQLYTVQAGEGLFSICRKFDVSQADINKANPEIEKGIKEGQEILIPIQKKQAKKKTENPVKENTSAQEFIQHKVEKKQTLFAISRKYDVSQEDIKKYNPEIANGLTEGIILKIPKVTKENKKKDTEKTAIIKSESQVKKSTAETKKTVITHKVQAKETIYSISRLYKVKVDDIIQLNPGTENKLTVGTDLKIPSNADTSNLNESISTVESNKSVIKTDSFIAPKNKVIKIGFLLPFMFDQEKKDPSVDRFIDFYSGSIIAIQEAKKKGISLEIFAYDTEKSSQKVTEILANPELKTIDLIIGPAFSNQVSIVGDFAKENKIYTLIPFTSKVQDIDTNPYLFQFNPRTDDELKFTTGLSNEKFKNAHIVFAEIPNISATDEGKIWTDTLQKELTKEGKEFSRIELTTSDYANFKSELKKGEQNLVIFNTNKYTYANPFISNLQSLTDEYDIILFEQYSWRNHDNEMPLSIFVSPFISDCDSVQTKEFNKAYTHLFSKEPSADSPRYDLLGYDLSNYFISFLHRYGTITAERINSYNFTTGIQSQPLFKQISNRSGFINQKLYLGEEKKEKTVLN